MFNDKFLEINTFIVMGITLIHKYCWHATTTFLQLTNCTVGVSLWHFTSQPPPPPQKTYLYKTLGQLKQTLNTS